MKKKILESSKFFHPNLISSMHKLKLFSRVLLLKLEKEKCLTIQIHIYGIKQGVVLFQSLLNQKDTQEKLGKLRFDLNSSNNTNEFQKTVKKFTEIISECANKTHRTKKRDKVNKKPEKPWYSENCTLLRK